MRRLTIRASNEDGAISVMAAVLAVAMLMSTALAVDVGRVAYVSRDQQGVVDRIALDAIRVVKGSSAATLEGLYADVAGSVERSEDRNPGSSGSVEYREVAELYLGRVNEGTFEFICNSEDACRAVDLVSGSWQRSDVTAVRVVIDSAVRFLFAIAADADEVTGIRGRRVVKYAEAAVGDPLGAVSAATSLVDLNDGLVRTFLSRTLGANADLTLVGWNGLLQTEVALRDVAAAVGAGSPSELLDTELTVDELADVIVSILSADSEQSAEVQATLMELAATTLGVGLGPVRLGDLLVIDPTAGSSAMDATVDAAGLLLGFAQVANHANGLALTLQLADDLQVDVSVIEPPQIAVGRPGMGPSGQWLTRATTAQLRLDVDLPLGTVAGSPSTDPMVDSVIADELQPFRDRIDAISTCGQALTQAGTSSGTIRSDLEAAIAEVEQVANNLGLLDATVQGLLDVTTSLLGGLTGGLSCLLSPNSTRDSIKADLHGLADTYQQLLDYLSGDGSQVVDAGSPVLSVRLAHGGVALDRIDCGGDVEAGTFVDVSGARIVLTSTANLAANPGDPAPVVVGLLDVDLGVLGSLALSLSSDMDVAGTSGNMTFTAPFPADAQTMSAGALAVSDALTVDASGTQLLTLPIGSIANELQAQVNASLGSLVGVLDASLVAPLLDALGVGLANIEARVLAARCDGPPRLLPRQAP